MAKDPAVLWYYRDYLSGTEEMTWAEQGAYARLLNKQADKGHLSLDSIKKILKRDFLILWPGIAQKFLQDDEGNFYNDRMDLEISKRCKNSKAQRDRINKYWNEQRNNHGNTGNGSTDNTTVYTTVKPIANAIANAKIVFEGGMGETKLPIVQKMTDSWMALKTDYPFDLHADAYALADIGTFLSSRLGGRWPPDTDVGYLAIAEMWERLAAWIHHDSFYKGFSLGMISKTSTLQTIWQKSKEKKNAAGSPKSGSGNRRTAGNEQLLDSLADDLRSIGSTGHDAG